MSEAPEAPLKAPDKTSDAGWLGALRVTGLARTLIDLGAVVSDPAVVEAAMESALRRDERLRKR